MKQPPEQNNAINTTREMVQKENKVQMNRNRDS